MSVRAAGKWLLVLLGTAILLALGAFAWMRLAPRIVPPGQPPLSMLGADSLPAFREVFNTHGDQVRVLVLLSPT